jgi:hypothetical protein
VMFFTVNAYLTSLESDHERLTVDPKMRLSDPGSSHGHAWPAV